MSNGKKKTVPQPVATNNIKSFFSFAPKATKSNDTPSKPEMSPISVDLFSSPVVQPISSACKEGTVRTSSPIVNNNNESNSDKDCIVITYGTIQDEREHMKSSQITSNLLTESSIDVELVNTTDSSNDLEPTVNVDASGRDKPITKPASEIQDLQSSLNTSVSQCRESVSQETSASVEVIDVKDEIKSVVPIKSDECEIPVAFAVPQTESTEQNSADSTDGAEATTENTVTEIDAEIEADPVATTEEPPSSPPREENAAPSGRRSSRIASVNAAYVAKQAAAPESPPREKRASREGSKKVTANASFFLSKQAKAELAEKERLRKEQLEREKQERLAEEERVRVLAEKARLLAEAIERDARLQEQLVRTREENNKMFCQKPINLVISEDGDAVANPFFVARPAASSSSNTVNLLGGTGQGSGLFGEEESSEVNEMAVLFPVVQNIGLSVALQLVKLRKSVYDSPAGQAVYDFLPKKRKIVTDLTESVDNVSAEEHPKSFSQASVGTNSCDTERVVAVSRWQSDLNCLEFAYSLGESDRIPSNPQYPTGASSFNYRTLWLMYCSYICSKHRHSFIPTDKGASLSISSTSAGKLNFLAAAPKPTHFLSPPPKQTSLGGGSGGKNYLSDSSVSSAVSNKDASGGACSLVSAGIDEPRLVLQNWLECWAGKRRTPKKPKAADVKDRKKRKKARYDSDEYDSGDANEDGEQQGLRNLLVLQGSSGCNKTALVHHFAKQMGYNVIEVNTSMVRSSSNVKKMISESASSQAVTTTSAAASEQEEDFVPGKKRAKGGAAAKQSKLNLILFDEVDVVFEEDAHFHSAITSLLKVSKCPIVLTSEVHLPFLRPHSPLVVLLDRVAPLTIARELVGVYSSMSAEVSDKEKQEKVQFEREKSEFLACVSILPSLADGDGRSCLSTLSATTSRENKQSSKKMATTSGATGSAGSSAVSGIACKPASSFFGSSSSAGNKANMPIELLDAEAVVDLTASPCGSAVKKAQQQHSSPSVVMDLTAPSQSSVVHTLPPAKPSRPAEEMVTFGSYLATEPQLDFAVFDKLGVTLSSALPSVTESSISVAIPSQHDGSAVAGAVQRVVVPIVTHLDTRNIITTENTVIHIFGKHFLQARPSAATAATGESSLSPVPLAVDVLMGEVLLTNVVVMSDCEIAVIVPANIFTEGVHTLVVKLSDRDDGDRGSSDNHSPLPATSVRSDVCGGSGSWLQLRKRQFKTLKLGNTSKGSQKAPSVKVAPVAVGKDLFTFSNTKLAGNLADSAAQVTDPEKKRKGSRLVRRGRGSAGDAKRPRSQNQSPGACLESSADAEGEDRSGAESDSGNDTDCTVETEEDEGQQGVSSSNNNAATANVVLPVRRRLQIRDDSSDDEMDCAANASASTASTAATADTVSETSREEAAVSPANTESTVQETPVISSDMVDNYSSEINALMRQAIGTMTAKELYPFNTAFLAPVSADEAPDYADIVKQPMDLGTIEASVSEGLYTRSITLQDTVYDAFPDLESFVSDVRLVFDNCLLYNQTAESELVQSAHKLSVLFETVLRDKLVRLTTTSSSSNSESGDLEESVFSFVETEDGFSLLLHNTLLLELPHYTSYNHLAAELEAQDSFSVLTYDPRANYSENNNTNAAATNTTTLEENEEVLVPKVESLDKFVLSAEDLQAALSAAINERNQNTAAGAKIEPGLEYTNEDARPFYLPFRNSQARGTGVSTGCDPCLDALEDISSSLDSLCDVDLLGSAAVRFVNYSDHFSGSSAPPGSKDSKAKEVVDSSAGNPEDDELVSVAVDSAGTGLEEDLIASLNTSNVRLALTNSHATLCRIGMMLSDASCFLKQSAIAQRTSRIRRMFDSDLSCNNAMFQLSQDSTYSSSCGSSSSGAVYSSAYLSQYASLLRGYKHAEANTASSEKATGDTSVDMIVTPAKGCGSVAVPHKEKETETLSGRLGSKRHADYLSSDEDDNDDQSGEEEQEEQEEENRTAVPSSTEKINSSGSSCRSLDVTEKQVDGVIDCPFIRHGSRRLALIRFVNNTLCHPQSGVFYNSNHSNSLCAPMALDLLPMLVNFCRTEQIHDSGADCDTFSVGNFSSGRRSSRQRGGSDRKKREKYVFMKSITELSENQLDYLLAVGSIGKR